MSTLASAPRAVLETTKRSDLRPWTSKTRIQSEKWHKAALECGEADGALRFVTGHVSLRILADWTEYDCNPIATQRCVIGRHRPIRGGPPVHENACIDGLFTTVRYCSIRA